MRKLTVWIGAAVLAFAGVACGSDGGGGGGSAGGGDGNAVLAAAQAADDAGSSRMEGQVKVEAGDQGVTVGMEGEFDFEEEIGAMTMTLEGQGIPGGETTIETILDAPYMYMKGSLLEPSLQGAEWGRLDMSDQTAAGGNQLSQDPTQYLEWLRGAGDDVEDLGREEVRGTETTHYSADLTVDGIIEGAPDEETKEQLRAQLGSLGDVGSLPMDVWIDEDGLPRRIEFSMDAPEGAAGAAEGGSIMISMELFDYGVDVDVAPPKDFQDLTAPTG